MEERKKTLISHVQKLKKLRGGIPTFVIVADIDPLTMYSARKALNAAPEGQEVDIILASYGGSPSDAYLLIRSFRERYKTVNVIIPYYAKSAATLLSFGASRLVMHEFGELGPIDAQIKKDSEDTPKEQWISALNDQSSLQQVEDSSKATVLEMYTSLKDNDSVRIARGRLLEMAFEYSTNLYKPLLERIDVKQIGIMARHLNVGKMYANRILQQYTDIDDKTLKALLRFLVYDCPDHGFVIDYKLLKDTLKLPNVMRTLDEPFGAEYDAEMRGLSELLVLIMYGDWDEIEKGGIVTFVDDEKPQKHQDEVKDKDKKGATDEGTATKEPTDNAKKADNS